MKHKNIYAFWEHFISLRTNFILKNNYQIFRISTQFWNTFKNSRTFFTFKDFFHTLGTLTFLLHFFRIWNIYNIMKHFLYLRTKSKIGEWFFNLSTFSYSTTIFLFGIFSEFREHFMFQNIIYISEHISYWWTF